MVRVKCRGEEGFGAYIPSRTAQIDRSNFRVNDVDMNYVSIT